jgi:hypothetical protein
MQTPKCSTQNNNKAGKVDKLWGIQRIRPLKGKKTAEDHE